MKWLAILVGIILIVIAAIYWMNPASSLPSFLPGYDPTLSTPHHKHAIGALILGLAVFAFAWFQGGKKTGNASS